MSHTHAHGDNTTSITYSLPSQLKKSQCFIKDDMAKQIQPFQKPRDFLWTGKEPKVGQRTETQMTFINGLWVRMSGVIDKVNPCPLIGTSGGCTHDDKHVKHFGGHPHQILVGRGILNFDFYDRHQDVIDKNTVYRMTYEMDWDKECMWILTKLEPIETPSTSTKAKKETKTETEHDADDDEDIDPTSPAARFQEHQLAACSCECMEMAPDGSMVSGQETCRLHGTSTSTSTSSST